jgi:hypothetical protein
LPEAGGLRDQRAGEVERMTAALNTYDAVVAWRRAMQDNVAKWAKANPEAWRMVQRVLKLRGWW